MFGETTTFLRNKEDYNGGCGHMCVVRKEDPLTTIMCDGNAIARLNIIVRLSGSEVM